MKRIFAILTFVSLCILPSHAVLKEKDLSETLSILRYELSQYYFQQQETTEMSKSRMSQMRDQMISIMKRSNQNALMLYSQKTDYIFDLTYACHEATEQYNDFNKLRMPFDQVISNIDYEANRYDEMIKSLQRMPILILNDKAKIDRNVCLTLATAIYNQLLQSRQGYKDDIQSYDRIGKLLKEQNSYAQKRYNTIQHNIFINGGESYPTILGRFAYHVKMAKETADEKYNPAGKDKSQWSSAFIFGIFLLILFYAIVAIVLNILVLRFLIPVRFRTKTFMEKRACIIMATSVFTFAIILGIIRATVDQNFIVMASNLLVEYAWLLGVILLSLLFRLDGSQITSGFRIYSPIIIMGFIVIAFRIIFIPNELVDLIFPPILLLCAIWQWNVIIRCNNNIPKGDIFYTWISLAVFVSSVAASWSGYTLLSVQLLIWWVMQLTCIQTITCVYDWLKIFERHHYKVDDTVARLWAFNLIMHVVLPIIGVASVMLSIYWAADVFDLSDICWRIFRTDFISGKNVCMSITRLSLVISLYFMFKYLAWLSIGALKMRFSKRDEKNAASRQMLGRNMLNILIWGVYTITVMNLLQIGNAWILVIAGGFSTGIGFASKDILENIYYGISLMAGRIHIGDYIECDGTRGVVSNISYTSTMLETDAGSVIAFQNSQLFTKNYKNLTRNHGYELQTIVFGIAYGSNVQTVRKLLIEELALISGIDKNRTPRVDLYEFGDNSVNLKVAAWVKVKEMYNTVSAIKEAIYRTMSNNNIDFPFPQMDLHVKDVPKEMDGVKETNK